MPAGVRKIPEPITDPTTIAIALPSPSRRGSRPVCGSTSAETPDVGVTMAAGGRDGGAGLGMGGNGRGGGEAVPGPRASGASQPLLLPSHSATFPGLRTLPLVASARRRLHLDPAVMSPALSSALFWLAAALVVVGQGVILYSTFVAVPRARAAGAAPAADAAPARRALEAFWAVAPVAVLALLLVVTHRAVQRPDVVELELLVPEMGAAPVMQGAPAPAPLVEVAR